MFNILTLNNISNNGLCQLPSDDYKISSSIKNPDGILLRSFSMHEFELPPSLLAVCRAGAGVNNIPIDKCSEKGVVVFNTPRANANGVKELVITALLLSSRKVIEGIEWTRTLKGQDNVDKLVEKGKANFAGTEIMGKKLGVIGLGAIGCMVANTAVDLGMEVMGYTTSQSVDLAWNVNSKVTKVTNLEQIYEECDYITVHVPLKDSTKNMFNENVFKKVKKGVKILNFSRGELVNNNDIKKALQDETVACYVTDFPVDEILGVENLITIPHLGASTVESEENCAVMATIQLKNYLQFGNIKNSVNFPNCELSYTGKKRICILYKNKDINISKIFIDNDFKISNMATNLKGNFAYSIIDIEGLDTSSIEEKLMKIQEVIKVRVI